MTIRHFLQMVHEMLGEDGMLLIGVDTKKSELLLNAAWSIVFFGFRQPIWALMVIIMLIVLLGLTIRWFFVVSRTAAYLLVPYFLWVCFATALNYKIWELN